MLKFQEKFQEKAKFNCSRKVRVEILCKFYLTEQTAL